MKQGYHKKNNQFHHKHSLGQNFITDDALFAQLVELSGVGPEDTVLEIGQSVVQEMQKSHFD